jgi:hypothetical protein
MLGAKSTAQTFTPASAACSVSAPVPAATSSSRWPGPSPSNRSALIAKRLLSGTNHSSYAAAPALHPSGR